MKKIALLLLTFLALEQASGQQHIENLVFEGAGIRGIAHTGVLRALEKRGIGPKIKKLSTEEKERLVKSGENAIGLYFEKR